MAAGLAGCNGFVGNVPGAAVDDQSRFHRKRESQMVARFVQAREQLLVFVFSCWLEEKSLDGSATVVPMENYCCGQIQEKKKEFYAEGDRKSTRLNSSHSSIS